MESIKTNVIEKSNINIKRKLRKVLEKESANIKKESRFY